jgi:uracil-DNA glycosylase family 4
VTDDIRAEAADIARKARRYVERERAAGHGDLLADGSAKSQRSDTPKGLPRDTARGREAPPARPEPVSAPLTNLFGEPEPEPAPKAQTTIVVDEPPPSMFSDDLNPMGLEPRAALAAESVPVLEQVAEEVRACTKCGLCETRTKAVPGVGTARGGIVFVGEAPGADEDRLGEPFVGKAGQLLDKIIKAMDEAQLIPGVPLDRSTVYICNVLKCRPPENRNPLPHEIEACSPYLRRQLEVLKPRIICCLGKFAAELLVGVQGTIGGMRGKVYRYKGAKLIVTYHPAYLLRSPAARRPVWEDMQFLAREYLSD